MRGVCSRKVLREFESLSPVRAFAFPRPNAKPPTATTANYTSGKYQIISDGQIVVRDYCTTKMGAESEYHNNFEAQLAYILVLDGIMTYSYKKNQLIFRGEKGGEITFRRKR